MKRRVVRGGSFNFFAWLLRSSCRQWDVPEGRYGSVGFRLVIKRRKP